MLLEIVLASILILFLLALWLGAFKSMHITEKTFSGGVLLYLDYRDHIKNIGSKFSQIGKDLELF